MVYGGYCFFTWWNLGDPSKKRHCVFDKNVLTSSKRAQMYPQCEQEEYEMPDKKQYYVVTKKAVPEVLQKVVEAKRLLQSEKVETVQDAADLVGISRSSFYKYKDDIFPFHENAKGKIITFAIQMDDEPGLLSDVLHVVADYHANILTIHQSIPINGIATLTLSVEILAATGDMSSMVQDIEGQKGVQYIKILARE